MMTKFSKFIPITLVLITINLWLISKNSLKVVFKNPELSIGQICGLLGIVLMAWVLVLTTRFKIVEDWHGGMDKNYQKHHWIASIAFVLLINHPLILAVQFLPNWSVVKNYLVPSSLFTYSLGVWGIYLFILGFIFTVIIKLPYDKWKMSHKIMGVAFVLGAIHSMIIGSDINRYEPLKWWIFSLNMMGIGSFIYTIFLYKFIGPRHDYEITKVINDNDITKIEMKPKGRTMEYSSGQFAYFQFNNKNISKEVHPFSLTSDPENQILTIAIKNLGDYTGKVNQLEVGTEVTVWGAYGRFFENEIGQKQVWIAGGIGITPFLSKYKTIGANSKIYLFYCTKNQEEAVFNNQFQNSESFKIINWCSEKMGRIDVAKIEEIVGNLDNFEWFACGPEKMMKDLQRQLPSKIKFNYENFNLLG